MVTIREAEKKDVDRIEEIHGMAIRQLGRESYTDRQVAAWAGDLEADEAGPDRTDSQDEADEHRQDGIVLVAETSGCVAGFGQVVPSDAEYLRGEEPDRGELRAVYVHPDVTREGIGTALLTGLEGRARERGVSKLGLHASLNAVQFYEANGYDRVRDVEHEFGDTGVTGRIVEMQKSL